MFISSTFPFISILTHTLIHHARPPAQILSLCSTLTIKCNFLLVVFFATQNSMENNIISLESYDVSMFHSFMQASKQSHFLRRISVNKHTYAAIKEIKKIMSSNWIFWQKCTFEWVHLQLGKILIIHVKTEFYTREKNNNHQNQLL